MRWDLRRRAAEQKAAAASRETEEIFTINHWRHPEVFLRWPGAITNGAPPVQLGGIDTANAMMGNTQTVWKGWKKGVVQNEAS